MLICDIANIAALHYDKSYDFALICDQISYAFVWIRALFHRIFFYCE